MQDCGITDTPGHHRQQLMVLHVVEIVGQVEIDDPRLSVHNCVCYVGDCLMCCPLRSIPVRARMKVSLENRLENQLERPLDNAIPDARNLENSLPSTAFRYRVFACGQRLI